jgi:NAD(P)-dependent dehydrogenase (short-subunit alcohol dehydrogenase family)
MSIHEQFGIAGKTVLLTGGGSRFGKPVAADLASVGATVIITSREHGRASDVAESIDPEKGTLHPAELNLSSTESIESLLQTLKGEFDTLDGLVNNAVARPMATLEDDLKAWKQSMRANATGVFELTRRVAKWMRESGGGSIINVGSIQGVVGPDMSLYEETDMYDGGDKFPAPDYFFHKGGLLNLTRYFASAYGRDGVRVNYVAPGGIENDQEERFAENYRQRTMLGRMAQGNDLAGPIMFLLSEASSYVTGASIPVDGGYTAK